MSATDHTLTAPERENIEELLRLHVLADDEQIVYDLFETLLTQRGVTYEARLATAEAEKEALRAEADSRADRITRALGGEITRARAQRDTARARAEAAEAALTGLVAAVEALAEASLQDGRGGAWVHDVCREAADDLLQVGLPSPSRREVHVWLRDRADSIEQARP